MTEMGPQRKYLPQVDFLKGLAILSVIVLHSAPSQCLYMVWAHFHIWQAVPVFVILMGVTSNLAVSHGGVLTLRQSLSWPYWKGRLRRLVAPFLVVFLISLFAAVAFQGKAYLGPLTLIGYLPRTGPGNYYVSILLQYLLLGPIVVAGWKRWPRLTVGVLFALDLSFEIIAPHVSAFIDTPYLYSACILRYLAAIAMGLWIADELAETGTVCLGARRNRFILTIVPFSLAYLIVGQFIRQPVPFFVDNWGLQNILGFPYAVLLVAILVRARAIVAATLRRLVRSVETLGRASYHIFLLQMLFFGAGGSFVKYSYFGVWPIDPLVGLILNITFTVAAGIVFWRIDGWVRFSTSESREYRPSKGQGSACER